MFTERLSMSAFLEDLVDVDDLEANIAAGHMARKVSPDGTKHLYCYTPKAQFDKAWNEVTIALRGVVTDAKTDEVLARPFPKFFNHGDPLAPTPPAGQRVWATDKMDGSLAVLQPDGTMTSKASFTSDVAVAATRLYQERYAGTWTPSPGVTYCFEYTSPDHRIVLDYGPEEELTLIGSVSIDDGFIYDPGAPAHPEWGGPRAEILGNDKPFEEVLAMPPRKDAEGLVVLWGVNNVLKLKQEDYLAMHRVVTNTNASTVWEAAAVSNCVEYGAESTRLVQALKLSPEKIEAALELGPRWLERLSEGVPDEFHSWLRHTRQALAGRFLEAWREARARYMFAAAGASTRAEMARELQRLYGDSELPWNISMEIWLNGGELSPRARADLWRYVRPKAARWGGTDTEREAA